MRRKVHYSVCENGGEISIGKGHGNVTIEPFTQFRVDGDRWVTRKHPKKKLERGSTYTFSMTITVSED